MNEPLRLLMVEDSEDDAEMLLRELHRGGVDVSWIRVQTAAAMRKALGERSWDVVLSDYSMPAFSAAEALATLRASGLDIPFIIVSGTIGEETAVNSLKAGAHDFLTKNQLSRLIPAMTREVREAAKRRELRAAEAALTETRERMRFALEAAGVGVWEFDLVTGKTVWSDVLERMHGLPDGGFGGTFEAFVGLIHPDDRERIKQQVAQFRRAPMDSRVEYRVTWPDGSTHWIARIGRAFYDDTGVPSRAAGISIDVTPQKQLEEQLRQAQKMEAIGQLAGGIAHDFNNLLTAIAGYSDLLLDEFKREAAVVDDLNQIRRAADSATALTRQLLAFSRRQVLAPQVLSLNDVLAGLKAMLRRLIEEHIRIEFRLAQDLAHVNVDPSQIEQVVLNLAVNARDAMQNGGVLRLETANVVLDDRYAQTHLDVQPGSHVLLAVTDTGSGIPSEIQAHIFEPFFTTKPEGQGTGLGLATVYGIVKQSDGHIRVHSEPGRGTTFKIYFPVAAREQSKAGVQPRVIAGSLKGSETILVVEDDAKLRTLDERILRRYGYTVLVAGDAAAAQRICADHRGPIHLVLTDVIMPGGSGRSVGDWVAQRRPEAKVVYMSGYPDQSLTRHGVLEPGTLFLQKPFTPEALVRKLREVLS